MITNNNVNERKMELLREKILTNAHISHNNAQYRLQQLNESEQICKERLKQCLKQFSQGINQVIQQYRQYMDDLQCEKQKKLQKQQDRDKKMNILKLKDVQNYLNSEKRVLKEIVEKAESGFEAPQEDKIHSMMRKNNLHSILQNVHRKQLKTQIKYLSEHVITSSGMIYVPDAHMSDKQELIMNQKLSALIQEVERLIGLEIVCEANGFAGTQQDPCETALKALNNQFQRLQKVDRLLNSEREDVSSLQKWINSFDSFTESLPIPIYPSHHLKSSPSSSSSNQPYNRQQIKAINNNLQIATGNIMANQNCHHDEIAVQLRKLVTKTNKIF